MPAASEPRLQPCFSLTKLAIGDTDLLETQLLSPALDIPGEHGEIRRLRLIALHKSNLKPQIARFLPTEGDTLDFGAALAPILDRGLVVYLKGDLGAGKTTLARGILRAFGYTGRVKSPTFTLVEVYKFSKLYLYHFDFYRFDDPAEFGEAGFRDYFGADAVCLVEWPEKAPGLPAADIRIELRVTGTGRTVDLHADTEVGRLCLDRLQDSSTP